MYGQIFHCFHALLRKILKRQTQNPRKTFSRSVTAYKLYLPSPLFLSIIFIHHPFFFCALFILTTLLSRLNIKTNIYILNILNLSLANSHQLSSWLVQVRVLLNNFYLAEIFITTHELHARQITLIWLIVTACILYLLTRSMSLFPKRFLHFPSFLIWFCLSLIQGKQSTLSRLYAVTYMYVTLPIHIVVYHPQDANCTIYFI
jgi:hypothetical protein